MRTEGAAARPVLRLTQDSCFPGSRRGSLRRAGAREAASEAGDGGAQAPGFRASPCSFVSPSAAAADMAAVLQQVLERSELNKLPKSTQNKLEKFLADQQSEIDGLKGRHERFKVESGKCSALRALGLELWLDLPLYPLARCEVCR